MALKKTEQQMQSYWSGYHIMMAAYKRTGNLEESFDEIYQSNASSSYANGAKYAKRRIEMTQERQSK